MNLLRFKKEELVLFLSKFLSASRKHKDAFTRSILIEPKPEGPCMLWVNAPENSFCVEIPVYNDGGRIEKPFVLELKSFFEFANNHDEEFLSIQENKNKHRLCTHSGIIDLENFSRMAKSIRCEDFWRPSLYEKTSGDVEEFLRFLAIAERSMIFSTISSHKKACIQDGTAFMNFGNIVVTVDGFSFKSIGVRASDFKVLRKSLEGSQSFDYQIHRRMFLFSTNNLKVTVPLIDYKDLYSVKDSVLNYEVKNSIDIPLQSIYNTVMFISKVTGGTDVISIESRSGKIFVEASTKIGRNLCFPICDTDRSEFATRMSIDLLKKSLNLLKFVSKDEELLLRIVLGVDGRLIFDYGRIKITAGVCK